MDGWFYNTYRTSDGYINPLSLRTCKLKAEDLTGRWKLTRFYDSKFKNSPPTLYIEIRHSIGIKEWIPEYAIWYDKPDFIFNCNESK